MSAFTKLLLVGLTAFSAFAAHAQNDKDMIGARPVHSAAVHRHHPHRAGPHAMRHHHRHWHRHAQDRRHLHQPHP